MYQFTDLADKTNYVSVQRFYNYGKICISSQFLQIGQNMYQFTDFTDRAKYISGSQILQIGKTMYQFTDLAVKTKYVSVHRFYR